MGINPLGPIAPNVVIIVSTSSCDFRKCPWKIGSAIAERARQGEVGGCTWRVHTAWPASFAGLPRFFCSSVSVYNNTHSPVCTCVCLSVCLSVYVCVCICRCPSVAMCISVCVPVRM